MTSKRLKIIAAIGLFTASAAALASNSCCGDLACCLQHVLACCF